MEMADGGKRSTIWAAMRSPTSKMPRKERVPHLRVDDVLLAERLGLCEEWVERWEQGGEWKEESRARDELPQFVRAALGRYKVLYFCLEELSPEAAAVREGRRRRSVPREDGEFDLLPAREEERPLATREDMEAVQSKAEKVRGLFHRYRRDLLLVADTNEFSLPTGIMTGPEDAEDALALLEDSLTWVYSLAGAYAAPFEKTLLKSKGLLYLTAYVLTHADARETRGRRGNSVDTALAGLARMLTKRKLSPSDLRAKLRKFEKDHER